jgi:AmmeMemoRadiSam system protein B
MGEPVLLFSSTDMNHYEADQVSRAKDEAAIERVLALDPAGLYQVVTTGNISMCGVLPTAIVLVAAMEMGASQAELVHYTNSGETTGDFRQVVGYAGLIIK